MRWTQPPWPFCISRTACSSLRILTLSPTRNFCTDTQWQIMAFPLVCFSCSYCCLHDSQPTNCKCNDFTRDKEIYGKTEKNSWIDSMDLCVCMCVFSIIYGCMSWLFLMFLGYGQLLVLDESLSVQLVSSWYQWICSVCIVLSENKYDTIRYDLELREQQMRTGSSQHVTQWLADAEWIKLRSVCCWQMWLICL